MKLLFICMIFLIWKLDYFYLDFYFKVHLDINVNLVQNSNHRLSATACDSRNLPHLLLYHYKIPLSKISSGNFPYALSALLICDFQYGLLQ